MKILWNDFNVNRNEKSINKKSINILILGILSEFSPKDTKNNNSIIKSITPDHHHHHSLSSFPNYYINALILFASKL